MPLTADDALELADLFGETSSRLRRWRFAHSDSLSNAQWDNLSSLEWSLLNASEDMVTMAVGLRLDNMEQDLAAIRRATAAAKSAIGTIQNVKKAIGVATALVVLAGAIMSKDPGAIVKAIGGVTKAIGKD